MSRVGWVNTMGVLVALAASVSSTLVGANVTAVTFSAADPVAVIDVPRIASASVSADQLLYEFCRHDRIVAITQASAEGPAAYRFAGRPTLASLDDIEAIVALAPDVLLVSNVADARRVERIRQAGVEIVELSQLTGMSTLLADVRVVASLCGAPDAGRAYAQRLRERMASIARGVPEEDRYEALYLSAYSDRYFGGTIGSSYHDVLVAAGLTDVAAARYRGWPQLSVEQILELDPEILVTRTGTGAALCGHASLRALRACSSGRVIELDGALLDDAGPGMVFAAERLYGEVYAASDREPSR